MQDKERCTTRLKPLLCKGLNVLQRPILCYIRNTVFKGDSLKEFKVSSARPATEYACPEGEKSPARKKKNRQNGMIAR